MRLFVEVWVLDYIVLEDVVEFLFLGLLCLVLVMGVIVLIDDVCSDVDVVDEFYFCKCGLCLVLLVVLVK